MTYDLNGKPYRIDEIKAKIKKDGVLKIVVPKMKMDDKENSWKDYCQDWIEEEYGLLSHFVFFLFLVFL